MIIQERVTINGKNAQVLCINGINENILTVTISKTEYDKSINKYKVYVNNGTTNITVNVGSHVLKNSFDMEKLSRVMSCISSLVRLSESLSPLRSSGTVTSRHSESASILSRSGNPRPVSQRDTALSE